MKKKLYPSFNVGDRVEIVHSTWSAEVKLVGKRGKVLAFSDNTSGVLVEFEKPFTRGHNGSMFLVEDVKYSGKDHCCWGFRLSEGDILEKLPLLQPEFDF